MRYLFALRLFSGLVKSMETGQWQPGGVPAIFKLMECMGRENIPADFVFFCKTSKEGKVFKRLTRVHFPEINATCHIVPYRGLNVGSDTVAGAVNDFVQAFYFLRFLFRKRYHLAYVDRGNIKLGLLSSLLGTPTVVRFLGIANFRLFKTSWRHGLLSPLTYLALKKRYNLVICSEDGSPSKALFNACLNRRTPYVVLLNGVDATPEVEAEVDHFSVRKEHDLHGDGPLLLFVGRLSEDKGALEFVRTLIRLLDKGLHFQAVLVCGGSDTAPFARMVDAASQGDHIKFVQSAPHALVRQYFRQADIYVSLNKYGNLSNTVLEAIREGKCVVMLGADEKNGTDASTQSLIPVEAALRVRREAVEDDLADTLERLIASPEMIEEYASVMRKVAEDLLWNWEDRTSCELALLEHTANRRPWPKAFPFQGPHSERSIPVERPRRDTV